MEHGNNYFLWALAAIAVAIVTVRVYRQTHAKEIKESKASEESNQAKETEVPSAGDTECRPTVPPVSAKKAFLANLSRFVPLLPQLDADKLDVAAWTEQVVDIDNPNLLKMWRQCAADPQMWRRVLASWGLKEDGCRSFTFLPGNAAMYDTADGSAPVDGERYRVERGCWVLSRDDREEGESSKRVVLKGVIVPAKPS